jgi:hypothetical protein
MRVSTPIHWLPVPVEGRGGAAPFAVMNGKPPPTAEPEAADVPTVGADRPGKPSARV